MRDRPAQQKAVSRGMVAVESVPMTVDAGRPSVLSRTRPISTGVVNSPGLFIVTGDVVAFLCRSVTDSRRQVPHAGRRIAMIGSVDRRIDKSLSRCYFRLTTVNRDLTLVRRQVALISGALSIIGDLLSFTRGLVAV